LLATLRVAVPAPVVNVATQVTGFAVMSADAVAELIDAVTAVDVFTGPIVIVNMPSPPAWKLAVDVKCAPSR
jgi:hypothetical protein